MLEPYLKSRGISWIDYAVVSHGDSDHINGLMYLLEESKDIGIGTLVLPVMGKGRRYMKIWLHWPGEKGQMWFI